MPRGRPKKIKETSPIVETPVETDVPYILTLKLNGEELTSHGTTVEEALSKLHPQNFHTKGIFTLSYGDKTSKPQYLYIRQMRRLFGTGGLTNEIHKATIIKRLKAFLA